MGLVVTLVLVGACYLLFRSFLKHLRRVPPTFDGVEAANGRVVDPSSEAGAVEAGEVESPVIPAERDRSV